MLTWEERIERIKEACSIKNNKQLEERLGLANGYINDLIKGKNKNPGKLAAALMKELMINPMWFEDETRDIFGRADFEKLNPPKHVLIQDMEKFVKEVVSDDLIRIKIRLKAVEDMLAVSSTNPSLEDRLDRRSSTDEHPPAYRDYAAAPVSLYTGDPEPGYEAEEQIKVPYMEDIAAGPPIAQSEDQTGLVSVPARLIRKGGRYYAARVRGTSMAEVGIRDGDLVLIRHADVPVDGAVQVVRYQGKSTLKRLREIEGGGWELHYEDGSGKVISVTSGDYEVQGEFVAILPGIGGPEGRQKGRRTHEEPFKNR
jgi:SOS-response transcriptional repressor LexA